MIGHVPFWALLRTFSAKIPKLKIKGVLKKIKQKWPKVFTTIRTQMLGEKASYPMRGGMTHADFTKFADSRGHALGDRLQGWNDAVDEKTGEVDMGKAGNWAFGKSKAAAAGGAPTYEECKPSDATVAFHRYGRISVGLAALGLPNVGDEWRFEHAGSDVDVMIVNGKGLQCKLWSHIKDEPYYTQVNARTSAAFGSDEWKNSFGEEMAEARKTQKTEIAEAEGVLAEKRSEGLMVGIKTPQKRVRRKAPTHG